MGIGVSEEHEALAASVRGFTVRHVTPGVVRDAVRAGIDQRPGFWSALSDQGLLGLHIPEEYGGQHAGLLELAIAVEEMGRALAPGPYVPSVLASALIVTSMATKAKEELLVDLAEGVRTGAVGLNPGLNGRREGDALILTGSTEPILGGTVADVFVLPVRTDRGEEWVAVHHHEIVPTAAHTDAITALDGLDLTRGVARLTVSDLAVPAERILTGLTAAREIAAVILGAEACGIAGWCVDTAASYAKDREQFGRPIGQFQAVKHKCARMLIALERARAAVWDAARAVSDDDARAATDNATDKDDITYRAAVAAVTAPDAAVGCAQDCIQVHGGIGYTWEHDAHLYYRRALTLRALTGRAANHAQTIAELALAGTDPGVDLELPAESESLRTEIKEHTAALAALEGLDRVAAIADGGWGMPYLPRPWGRAAAPLEQVLIHQELRAAGVKPPVLMIGAWVVPSLVAFGTAEQQQRFLPPTLRGEILWCQLFSEPGAGSDLASLQTKAARVEGGFTLTGQKIWTSLAQHAQWGICVARTDPAAPKHQGITYFLVDMKADGVDVRPLRELTGEEIFNEVFLDDVFVPNDRVVGEVNHGWQVARTTLTAERVNLSTGWQLGGDLPRLLELVASLGLADDPVVRDGVGRLVCDDRVFSLLGTRATLKQLSGVDVGATANVSKLVGMEHGQRLTEYGFSLLGGDGALTGRRRDGLQREWTRLLLAARAMTIGGGTTEVNLNVIAERLLGLPRDPEPGR
jgi:3-oxochol-4-en-24-oyl-CoA dehydrogenase